MILQCVPFEMSFAYGGFEHVRVSQVELEPLGEFMAVPGPGAVSGKKQAPSRKGTAVRRSDGFRLEDVKQEPALPTIQSPPPSCVSPDYASGSVSPSSPDYSSGSSVYSPTSPPLSPGSPYSTDSPPYAEYGGYLASPDYAATSTDVSHVASPAYAASSPVYGTVASPAYAPLSPAYGAYSFDGSEEESDGKGAIGAHAPP